jgi:hypothetical protein
MTRGDSVICGTTTTGTGTLTLAACPVPPGGIDFEVIARAFGIASSGTTIVSYTLIEYTDSSFITAKQHEKGFGVLTLGASVGIANCTLARTTIQSSATSLDTQPATQNLFPGTGITIGTAANTLVFIGPSVMDMPAYLPYYDTTQGTGIPQVGAMSANTGQSVNASQHYYNAFEWRVPLLVKRCTTGVWASFTGTTNAYAAIYGIGTDGKPGRLLIDFGVMGAAGSSLTNGFTSISSMLHSTGFFLMPGEYYFNYRYTLSGGTAGTIQTYGSPSDPLMCGRMGSSNGLHNAVAWTDASGVITPAPNPAYVAGWTPTFSTNFHFLFLLAPT